MIKRIFNCLDRESAEAAQQKALANLLLVAQKHKDAILLALKYSSLEHKNEIPSSLIDGNFSILVSEESTLYSQIFNTDELRVSLVFNGNARCLPDHYSYLNIHQKISLIDLYFLEPDGMCHVVVNPQIEMEIYRRTTHEHEGFSEWEFPKNERKKLQKMRKDLNKAAEQLSIAMMALRDQKKE